MNPKKPVRIAVVGCGVISKTYIPNMIELYEILEVVGCHDADAKIQRETAEAYGIRSLSMEEILMDSSIELVVNLTPPAVHYRVIKELLLADKHVYTEKVLAVHFEQAKELVELAENRGLLLAAAPDTFLGAAGQTARFVVESGLIGYVTSSVASLNRDFDLLAERFPFTTRYGGGIGMDVGIYYIASLLDILGPVKQVAGFCQTLWPKRTHHFVGTENFGKEYELQEENIHAGTLLYESGVVGSVHFNGVSIQNEMPLLTIYGTQGVLFLGNPNLFGDSVEVILKGEKEKRTIPHTHGYSSENRGLGVAEMAWSLRLDRTPRTNGAFALHCLEVLHGIRKSSKEQVYYSLETTFQKQPPLPRGFMDSHYSQSQPEASLVVEPVEAEDYTALKGGPQYV